MSSDDPNKHQVGGTHYRTGSLQPWDFIIRHYESRFLEGSVIKYLCRWREKEGEASLLKAEQHLQKLQYEFAHGTVRPMSVEPDYKGFVGALNEIASAYGLTRVERYSLYRLRFWVTREDLISLLVSVKSVREAAYPSLDLDVIRGQTYIDPNLDLGI
jgi:hypothetical protein